MNHKIIKIKESLETIISRTNEIKKFLHKISLMYMKIITVLSQQIILGIFLIAIASASKLSMAEVKYANNTKNPAQLAKKYHVDTGSFWSTNCNETNSNVSVIFYKDVTSKVSLGHSYDANGKIINYL